MEGRKTTSKVIYRSDMKAKRSNVPNGLSL